MDETNKFLVLIYSHKYKNYFPLTRTFNSEEEACEAAKKASATFEFVLYKIHAKYSLPDTTAYKRTPF